jgi:hypothetical protein
VLLLRGLLRYLLLLFLLLPLVLLPLVQPVRGICGAAVVRSRRRRSGGDPAQHSTQRVAQGTLPAAATSSSVWPLSLQPIDGGQQGSFAGAHGRKHGSQRGS